MTHKFKVGHDYNRRADIHGEYGGQQQGGISTPADHPYVFIFTGESGEEYGYTDGLLDDGSFLYTGEGQTGPMEFVRGNLAIRDHEKNGKALLLFKSLGHAKPYRFLGQFSVADWKYRDGPDKTGATRQTIQFGLVPNSHAQPSSLLSLTVFDHQFDAYRELVQRKSGVPFTDFGTGLVGEWENYKSDLRAYARNILAVSSWTKGQIGTGEFTRRMIRAIEVDLGKNDLKNNLVFWQGQKGPASREHLGLLEALDDPKQTTRSDELLFSLFATDEPDEVAFNRLLEVIGAKYAALAYIFFLKDDARYAPIQTGTLDAAFELLGIDLKTTQRASWENYESYNRALGEIRDALRTKPGLANTSLLDAHTFCWTLIKLPGEADQKLDLVDSFDAAIRMMASSVSKTVRRADGRVEVKRVKLKELHMTAEELKHLLRELLSERAGVCALTGLPFHMPETPHGDPNFYPSLDRINSSGHYSKDNLQIVCRFVNFWKSSTDDAEFRGLLKSVKQCQACS